MFNLAVTNQVKIACFVPQIPGNPQKGMPHQSRHSSPPSTWISDEASVADMRASSGKIGFYVEYSPYLSLGIEARPGLLSFKRQEPYRETVPRDCE